MVNLSVEANQPAATLTLSESHVREKYGVTVVGIKRANEDFQHATADTRILPADLLIVSGPTRKIEQFAGRTKI